MARRTRKEALETREGILDAAEACFLEHGLSRTSLEAIASRAGCTRGAVYWHFKNKIEVLDAVLDRVQTPMLMRMDAAIRKDTATPLANLLAVTRESLEEFGTNPHIRNAIEILEMRCELVEETASVFERHLRGHQRARANIETAFTRAAAIGKLKPGVTVETCTNTLMWILFGALHTHFLVADRQDMGARVMASLEIALQSMVREDYLAMVLKGSHAVPA